MGDIQNHVEKLKTSLKKIKYRNQKILQIEELNDNNPSIFLQIVHYTLIDYEPEFYKNLLNKGYELFSKNDLRFVEQVYKLVIKEFSYKPAITISQFLSEQYLEHKVIMIDDIINIVLQKTGNIQTKPQQKTKQEKQNICDEYIQQEEQPKKNNTNPQVTVIRNINYIDKENCPSQMNTTFNQQIDDEEEDVYQHPTPFQNQEIPQRDSNKKQQQNLQAYLPQQSPESLRMVNSFVQQQQQFYQNLQTLQSLNNIQVPQMMQSQPQVFQYQPPQFSYQQPPLIQTVQPIQKQISQQPVQQDNNIPQPNHKQQSNQQTYVTQGDLNKVLQLIAVSNQNIQTVMKKFEELQTTVHSNISALNARMILLENNYKKTQIN